MMTDPLADMLTRIRNANRIERPGRGHARDQAEDQVAQVLKDEGFILDYQVGFVKPDEQGTTSFTRWRR